MRRGIVAEMVMDIPLILFALIGLALLLAAAIDLRTRILPNELVLVFLALACGFHLSSDFAHLSLDNMLLGVCVSSALMLGVRFVANWKYQQEALGLGDVKLLAASGAWLGPENFFVALSVGAFAGLLHGLVLAVIEWRKSGDWPELATLSMPAGPGFIIGILGVGAVVYGSVF